MIIFVPVKFHHNTPMNRIIPLLALTLIFACQNTTWTITKNGVGPIISGTTLDELAVLFPSDSLVAAKGKGDALIGDVEIFNSQGKLKLVVAADDGDDPTSKIAYVRIVDPQFTTQSGIGPSSTFGQIKDLYQVEGIDNAINSVVISFKDAPWHITIDKTELPENIRYDFASKIELAQIPGEAKIKYFIYSW